MLAVLGTGDDVPALRRLTARETGLEQDGRAAIDEIENRVAAGREPLQVLKALSLGNRIASWLFGLLGVASVLLGVAGFVVALSHHRSLGLVPVVRGLGVIGFGFWLLEVARTGKMSYTGRDS